MAWSDPKAGIWGAGKLGPKVISVDRNLYCARGLKEFQDRLRGHDVTWADLAEARLRPQHSLPG